MNFLKTALLASSLVACGVLSASAQSSSGSMNGPPAMTDTAVVSPSTHCRDTNGHIKLKSAMDSSNSGSGQVSSSSDSGTVGSAGSRSTGGSKLESGSEATTAATLPICNE